MLDTNAASGLVKGQPTITARFKAEASDRVCLSAVTEGEMLFGRDVLVAEEDHEIFGKRAVNFVELPV